MIGVFPGPASRFVHLCIFGCTLSFFWGVEIQAAKIKTDSSVLVMLLMSSTLFSRGFSSMCELTNFLNLSQFVLFDVILEGLSFVSGRWCRLKSTGQ